jgi:hypothetical protein
MRWHRIFKVPRSLRTSTDSVQQAAGHDARSVFGGKPAPGALLARTRPGTNCVSDHRTRDANREHKIWLFWTAKHEDRRAKPTMVLNHPSRDLVKSPLFQHYPEGLPLEDRFRLSYERAKALSHAYGEGQ